MVGALVVAVGEIQGDAALGPGAYYIICIGL